MNPFGEGSSSGSNFNSGSNGSNPNIPNNGPNNGSSIPLNHDDRSRKRDSTSKEVKHMKGFRAFLQSCALSEDKRLLRNDISNKLAGLTYSINDRFRSLQEFNLQYEDLVEKADYFKHVGKDDSALHYLTLARAERLKLGQCLYNISNDLSRRESLVEKGQRLFTNAKFYKFKDVTRENAVIYSIGHTLAHNKV